jgi:hypothetical protein
MKGLNGRSRNYVVPNDLITKMNNGIVMTVMMMMIIMMNEVVTMVM